jgi:spore germination cell wall hydrolase CwlJ-like protein
MKKFIMAAVMLMAASSAHANMNILFSPESEPQAWCLAQNIYYEARGSNLADQAAVVAIQIQSAK